MPRKQKSIYQRIEKIESEILSTESYLSQLKSQLKELYEEKDKLEMQQAWTILKSKGISLSELESHFNKA